MTEPVEDYSPERIMEYLEHWQELTSAAEGGTGSLSGNGAGRGERLALACLIADIERATDQLPLYWDATMRIFRMQGRGREWFRRRSTLEEVDLDAALAHMAQTLGWKP